MILFKLLKINIPMKPQISEGETLKVYWEEKLPFHLNEKEVYDLLTLRLYNINEWKGYFTVPAPDFLLADNNGSIIKNLPEVGDYIRIDLHGPGTSTGNGYDWVRIDFIKETITNLYNRNLQMKVKPSQNPVTGTNETAHFYTGNSFSEFCVGQEGQILYGWVRAGGEQLNLKEASGLLNKLRNLAVGITAKAGMSEIQWEQFIRGILQFK